MSEHQQLEYEPTGLSVEFRAAPDAGGHDGVHDGVHDEARDMGDLELRILRTCGQKPQGSVELLEHLGFTARSRNFRKAMGRLLDELSLIERTLPDKPKSKNQKYRLTAKGRCVLQSLDEK